MICPATRAAALTQLAEFVEISPLYGRDRNHVIPGNQSVSRLSPAIRHRIISEDEVALAVLQVHKPSRVEKFTQEVYWRRYWKSWLSLRPQVWRDFSEKLAKLRTHPCQESVRRIAAADSGNVIIDHFSRELTETGYLHNHARMWYAAWWIHEARMPWELGADFFYQHLLDGDPASNTLSWRWVAGLQTPGKTYLARRANLEKYLAAELLEALASGLPAFENPSPYLPEIPAKPAITAAQLPPSHFQESTATGLWVHEEDLSPETSPLAVLKFRSILATTHPAASEAQAFPPAKREWLTTALTDAAQRAEGFWKIPATFAAPADLAAELLTWAMSSGIRQLAALRPDIGPLHDALPEISTALTRGGVHLALIDRPADLALRPLASGGFFQFWEKMQKKGLGNTGAPPSSSNAQLTLF